MTPRGLGHILYINLQTSNHKNKDCKHQNFSRLYEGPDIEIHRQRNTEGGTADGIQYKVLKLILKSTETAPGSCRHRVKNA